MHVPVMTGTPPEFRHEILGLFFGVMELITDG